jgi:hypothetical protein
MRLTPKRNRYGAKKVELDGYKFDSIAESRYYGNLKLLKAAKKIADFTVHPKYVLLSPYKHHITGVTVKGVTYTADFLVTNLDGSQEVVDVKSEATRKKDAYILKKKMFETKYGIAIKEVS